MKIMSKFVLAMYGVFDLIVNKPHYYEPSSYTCNIASSESECQKIIRFLNSIFNTDESNLDILKPLSSVTVDERIL